jgi:TonB family protein
MKKAIAVAVVVIWPICLLAQASQPKTPKTCSEQKLLKDDKGKIVWFTPEQMKARATKMVNVEMPTVPMQARISGEVTLGVVVGKNGKSECVWVISGHPILTPRAIVAAKKWEFQPAVSGGKVLAFSGVVRFKVTNSVWSY